MKKLKLWKIVDIMAKNITYYLGAGASRNAIPIWKEQSEAMISLANTHLGHDRFKTEKNSDGITDEQKMLWDIGYFGFQGERFGTVDTYAKKLVLNNSETELNRLKLSVSSFFTIWHQSNNFPNKDNSKFKDEIDRRYISLMASILKKGNSFPEIKENLNFVTWNYDLQLEAAYKEFCDNADWDFIKHNLRFQSNTTNISLKICHLNGYHGFYITENNEEKGILDNLQNINEYKDVIKNIYFTYQSQNRGQLNYKSHINYAWENSDLAQNARNEAKRIISESDVIVIIGYSFPTFNREIDKEILGEIKEAATVIYQDPKASLPFLKRMIPDWKKKGITIEIEKDNMEYFVLPDDF